MKKFLGLVLILGLTLCGLPFSSNAVVEEKFEFNNQTIEIIYSGNSISSEKIREVVVALTNDDSYYSMTYGILCIFGHKLETMEVKVTDHNYYSSSPYCRKTVSEVEMCTRESCTYFSETIISQTRISACHG